MSETADPLSRGSQSRACWSVARAGRVSRSVSELNGVMPT